MLRRVAENFVRRHGIDRRPHRFVSDLPASESKRFYVPIREHSQTCQSCDNPRQSLFMGVCHTCEMKAWFSPCGPSEYICWVPAEYWHPDNPAFARHKWFVRVA